MRRTRTRRVLAALSMPMAFGLVAAACGGDDSSSSTTAASSSSSAAPATTAAGGATTAATTATTSGGGSSGAGKGVALMYDITGRGDKSFNDAAAAGLDQAVKEFGVKPTEFTPTGDNDRADRLKLAVDGKNGLVICVGFLWGDTCTASATANTGTSYAIIDSTIADKSGNPLPNAASNLFAENEGSFLVGAAAALKSTTGHIGFIGGVENDLIKKFEAGYAAGAKAVKADIKIDVQYITQPPDFGGFNDPVKGKAIATSMYQGGADIIYSAAGGSGKGGFEAAKEFSAKGTKVWAIGVDSDQYNIVDPSVKDYVLTSMLKRVDVAVYETIKDYVGGGIKSGIRTFDLKAGGVGYATSGGFVDDIKSKLDDYAKQIVDGKITVPAKP